MLVHKDLNDVVKYAYQPGEKKLGHESGRVCTSIVQVTEWPKGSAKTPRKDMLVWSNTIKFILEHNIFPSLPSTPPKSAMHGPNNKTDDAKAGGTKGLPTPHRNNKTHSTPLVILL